MTISIASTTLRRSLASLALAATLTGVAACGGTGKDNSAPTPDTTASASLPQTSAPASNTPAATGDAPVPVESNPPGDIPDNLAFVRYTNQSGRYAFTHPEGWAQTGSGTSVRFTDKLNGVTVDSLAASGAPTTSNVRSVDVQRLQKSVPAFELRDITSVTVPAGQGVRIVFRRNSDPDPVTGKVYRDEVEEYLIYSAGRLVRMDLYGPVGADNVDAYRTMSQSLTIR